MVSPFSFIVKPVDGRRYSNTVKAGEIDLILSSSKEDHTVTNREAEVISCPSNYNGPVKPGDALLVHHNVFRVYNDMKGYDKNGRSYFKDGLYFIDDDQWYGYRSGDDWFARGGFCFVRPSKTKKYFIKKPGSHEHLHGEIVIPDSYLESIGVSKGTEVIFTENSEYEFRIKGETLYRVYSKDICMIIQ